MQSYSRHNPEAPPTFRWLNDIAQLRFALALSADYLCTYVAETPEKIALKHRSRMMMEQFVALLSACLRKPQLEDLSLYLAKQIARRHGMVLLKRLNQEHSFVLPVSLQQHQVRTKDNALLLLHRNVNWLVWFVSLCDFSCSKKFQTSWCCLVMATVNSGRPLCKQF